MVFSGPRCEWQGQNGLIYDNIPFDVMRVKSGNVYQADFCQQTVVLPLAATGPSQRLCFSDGTIIGVGAI